VLIRIPEMSTITGWAIIGPRGLYTGWWRTRREAMKYHSIAMNKPWELCKRFGDRAVKILIDYPAKGTAKVDLS